MPKFYRVKKDTFMWKAGAILTDQGQAQYVPIEDVWNVVEGHDEYISAEPIESPLNAEYFERVYADSVAGKIYRTKDQLVEMYDKAFKA